MMHEKYILHGTEPVLCNDLLTWAHWFKTAERQVARTEVAEGVTVSTAFLGFNYAGGDGPPVLFETMVFWPNNALDRAWERYTTWAEAEQGHAVMVARVQAAHNEICITRTSTT